MADPVKEPAHWDEVPCNRSPMQPSIYAMETPTTLPTVSSPLRESAFTSLIESNMRQDSEIAISIQPATLSARLFPALGPARQISNLSPLSRPFFPKPEIPSPIGTPGSDSPISHLSRSSFPILDVAASANPRHSESRLSNLSRCSSPAPAALFPNGTPHEVSKPWNASASRSPASEVINWYDTLCEIPDTLAQSQPSTPVSSGPPLAPIGTPRQIAHLPASSSRECFPPPNTVPGSITTRQASKLSVSSSPRQWPPSVSVVPLAPLWSPRSSPSHILSPSLFSSIRTRSPAPRLHLSSEFAEMRDRSKSYVTRFRTLSRILRHNMVAWWVLTKFYDYQVLRDVEYLSQDVYLEFLDVISWIEWIEEDGVTGNRKKMVKQAWARGMEYLGKFENDEQYMDVEQAVEILPVGEGWAEGLTIEEVKKEELKPKLESRITEWDAMVRERVGELVIKPWSLLGSSNGHITSRFAPIEREEEEDESEQYDDSSDTVTEVCSDWEGKTEGECKEEFEVYEENGKGKSSAKGVLEVQFEAQDKLRAQQVSKILVEQQRQTFSVPGKVASAEEQR